VLSRVASALAGLVAPMLLVMGVAGAALRRYRVVG
jgi:hypothetical protein